MSAKAPNKRRRRSIDVARSLAGKGFFPETVPPCFTSSALSELLHTRRGEITSGRLSTRTAAKLIRYSSTKNTGARRMFSTPHPLNYLFICEFLKEHWREIQSFFANGPSVSASVPSVEPETEVRAIKITPFGDLDLLVHKAIKHSAYLLKTDVAQFYPSIYTHSIPWAFHSREKSKKDRQRDSKAVFFNELDYHVRNCQDGQTHGLFVGPDAARIVSELILTAVDEKFLAAAAGKIVGAVRYVDDYYLGVQSEADAATVLSALEAELNSYELTINDVKTKVVPTSQPADAPWPLELHRLARNTLSEFDVSEAGLTEIFNASLMFAAEYKYQSPIKLLLRELDKFQIHRQNEFEFAEPYFMRFVHHFSHAIDYVCMIVGARVLVGEPIDKDAWTDVLDREISRYARLRQHHEVAWLLWLAIVAGIKVQLPVVEAIIRTENAHLTSMLVAAFRDGYIGHKPAIELPPKLEMVSDKWLLFHECAVAGLAKPGAFEKDELELHSNLVAKGRSFIDFSVAEQKLKTEKSVIDGVRFGYDLEGETDDLDEERRGRPLFTPSTQDF